MAHGQPMRDRTKEGTCLYRTCVRKASGERLKTW